MVLFWMVLMILLVDWTRAIPLITTTTALEEAEGPRMMTTTTRVLSSPRKAALRDYRIVRVENVRYSTDEDDDEEEKDETKGEVRSFVVNAFGETFDVEVFPSKVLSEGFTVSRWDGEKGKEEDAATRDEATRVAKKCAYKGRVKGENGRGRSRVSANLCAEDGYAHVAMLAKNMSVSLMMPHEDFKEEVEEIRRVRRRKILNDYGEEENDTEGNGLENVDFIAFNAADEIAEENVGEQRDRIKFMPSRNEENEDEDVKRRKLRAIDYDHTRVIELYVHIDEARVSNCDGAFECVVETISIMNYVSALYENAFNPNIEIVVKEIGYTNEGATDPWGTVSKGTCTMCSDQEVNSDELLDEVTDWATSVQNAGVDVLSVLSGHNFDGGTIGLAYTGGACTDYATNVNEVNPANSLRYSAATVAHEIGHNLGFLHDGDEDNCPDTGLIMAAKAGYELETEWSTCTVAKYSAVYSQFACLKQGDESECGNGIVEEGEECDCWNNDCSDTLYGNENSCCDAETCRLKPGKACSSYHDGCCDSSCAIKPNGEVCRDAVSTCDVQEKCDGSSKSCAADVWKPYGTKCAYDVLSNRDIGTCFRNECRNVHFWCQQIDQYSHGGDCVTEISFPETVCAMTAFKCYDSPSSCTGTHVYPIQPEKGYPCSSVPNTSDGVFAKVCDGNGGCIAPNELDNLRGPYNTPSAPVPNVDFNVNQGCRNFISSHVALYFVAMLIVFAEMLLC